jgi:hypothetical protein
MGNLRDSCEDLENESKVAAFFLLTHIAAVLNYLMTDFDLKMLLDFLDTFFHGAIVQVYLNDKDPQLLHNTHHQCIVHRS